MKELQIYCKNLKKLRERAEYEYELVRIENMLRGKITEKFIFKPPLPPVFKIFVSIFVSIFLYFLERSEMAPIIKEALLNRVEWEMMQEKKERRQSIIYNSHAF